MVKRSPFRHPYIVFSIRPGGGGFKVISRGLRQPWQLRHTLTRHYRSGTMSERLAWIAETPAADEDQASAGARLAPISVLYPWIGSGATVAISESRHQPATTADF